MRATSVEPAAAADLAAVVTLIVAEQRQVDRMVPTLGDEPDGVLSELEDLEPPWTETVRVVRDEAGGLAGAVLADWDPEVGQAWIHGPWVPGADERWDLVAGPLVAAALAQVPQRITRRQLSGHVANVRLAALARNLGWRAGEVSHVLVADRSVVEGWPEEDQTVALRPGEADDLATIGPLHDAEFPTTYATAEQLLREAGDQQVLLVAEHPHGGVRGYAAGRIQPDGEGYIDFVAVEPSSRGQGVGRRLVTALSRQLVARAPKGQIALSVQDHREPARALYEQLGFRTTLSMVGYRSPE